MDIVARREVHQRVASPFAAPQAFVHFLFNAGGRGRIADIRIDFHQEVTSDNHRFRFRMVDIGRQYGASGCNFVAYEFGRDISVYPQFFAVHVFPNGYIFHFRCDDALFGIIHLGHLPSGLGTIRPLDVRETQVVQTFVLLAHPSVFGCQSVKLFHIAPL